MKVALVKSVAANLLSEAVHDASRNNRTVLTSLKNLWEEYAADKEQVSDIPNDAVIKELSRLGFTFLMERPQRPPNLNFNLQKLLADFNMGELFNKEVELDDKGLFSHENTYNGIMINVVGEMGLGGSGGIWDADVQVFPHRGLLEVNGGNDASGGTGHIIALINPMGDVISQIIKLREDEYYKEYPIPLHLESFFVEPKTWEVHAAIVKAFGDGVYEE